MSSKSKVNMTANQYQKLAMRTASNQTEGEGLVNFTLGLVGESGEVADEIKKVLFHGHDLDKDKICKELGDVCWYVAMMSTVLGLELEEVMQRNINKLAARYPEGFSVENSLNRRDEGKEL